MKIRMRKNKRITIKSVIASVLVIALLFNVITPAYASREGNTGNSSTFSAMLMGAYNGASASSSVGWKEWAVGLFVQLAVGYADLYYYYNNYSDYGRALISFNIGGTRINITRAQMVSMVASVAASTVAGAVTGEGISAGSVVNNLTKTFVQTVVKSSVYQILVKKFGWDPNLASLASSIAGDFVSDNWNLISRVVPQAGTMLDELIDPNDKQQKLTKGFLDKLKRRLGVAKKGSDGPKESDYTFTKEELPFGIDLVEKSIKEKEKQYEQLSAEKWHSSSVKARKLAAIENEKNELIGLWSGLKKLNSEIENNAEIRKSPYGTPIKSAQDSVVAGLRSVIDKQSDPVADATKKFVDNTSMQVVSVVNPSLAKQIKDNKPIPIEIKRSNVDVGVKQDVIGGVQTTTQVQPLNVTTNTNTSTSSDSSLSHVSNIVGPKLINTLNP